MPVEARMPNIIARVCGVFADTSGMGPDQIDTTVEFVEQGFDSLFLTQAATALKKEFAVKVTFRQLMEEYSDVGALAQHLDNTLPPDPAATPIVAPVDPVSVAPPIAGAPQPLTPGTGVSMSIDPQNMSSTERLIQRQLDIIQEQLAMLRGVGGLPATVSPAAVVAAPVPVPAPIATTETPAEQPQTMKNAPRAGAKIVKQSDAMTPAQSANLQDFIRHYNARTRSSKDFAQEHRKHMADPRTASGFRPAFKEMVYQIVVEKTKGSRMWDIDGNVYIDLVNGFGSNMLGHLPEYVRAALHEQTDLGLEIGPQTALAGDVAELFCELSGNERMAFSNTGSEAVAGAVRVARTVTGRSLIVTFDGDYHGIFDEVLVRGTPSLKTLPASPGINRGAVEDMLVLPFNDDAALQAIRERAEDVAGILVECVQGGDPGVQPGPWLKKLRDLATEIDAPLICDEVITGFRIHQQGAQGYFGIEADIATYGKVIGGGLPIGVIAGKADYMDALDGGHWQFGDDSIPEAGVTYFAGTFVRHPLTMAASRAALRYLKEEGPQLQQRLNQMADDFAAEMNEYFTKVGAPWKYENFGSLMNLKTTWDSPYQELLYYLLRDNGVHIWAGRPCFLTDAHTKDDLAEVRKAFERAIETLVEMGFIDGLNIEQSVKVNEVQEKQEPISIEPPVEGARLGRDRNGNPGWFIADPDRPGKYYQVGVQSK